MDTLSKDAVMEVVNDLCKSGLVDAAMVKKFESLTLDEALNTLAQMVMEEKKQAIHSLESGEAL